MYFNFKKKYLSLALVSLSISSAYSLSTSDIYEHLKKVYPNYNGITYTKPSNNYLSNQWLIQTPGLWGKNMSTYNAGFNPSAGYTMDKDFYIPTCKTSGDCNGYSVCSVPDYTADIKGNKKSLCTTSADTILSSIYRTITSANRSVDIVTLQPGHLIESIFTTEAFTSTIKNALISLAKKTIRTGNSIQVRFMQGGFLPITSEINQDNANEENKRLEQLKWSQNTYLSNIVNALPKDNHLNISVGTMRSCQNGIVPCGNDDMQKDPYLDFAWNHGKIIDVDGETLITGGHNLWGQDYLQKDPVNDLSIEISGPIVVGATSYANAIWNYTCKNQGTLSNLFYTYKNGKYSSTCLPNISTKQKSNYHSYKSNIPVSAMSVAKLNNNVLKNDADQSEISRVYAFNSARKSIKITQQALFVKGVGDVISRPILHPLVTKDGTVMEALSNALSKGVSVYIVTSSLGGSGYSSNVDLKYIWDYLKTLLRVKHHMTNDQANNVLSTSLHLGFISYDGKTINDKSHNKVWIVDDKVFYIGSHNIYASSLQQFGVIIDSNIAAKLLETKLWNPLWNYSQKYKN